MLESKQPRPQTELFPFMDATVQALLQGDHRALSRLLSVVERGDPMAAQVMEQIYPYTGKAYCVGITGPPGSGKSTMVGSIVQLLRTRGLEVGVIAVDPSSPYSGGALLGDRVRMNRHYLDPGVFIRSIATRGSHGGLPRIINGVVKLVDASSKDVVLVETVGVGQTELSVMGVADTVVVTMVPEAGDIIQTMKAGLLEIADIYVVNKSDLKGADRMIEAIESMLNMAPTKPERVPPVLATRSNRDEGIEELYDAVLAHRHYMEQNSLLEMRRRKRRTTEFLGAVQDELGRRLLERISGESKLMSVLHSVDNGEQEAYSSALSVLEQGLLSDIIPN